MLNYTLLAAVALTAAVPAAAEDISFVRDGVRYKAQVTQKGDTQIIHGRAEGTNFTLKVANGWVKGSYGGLPVSYPVPAPSESKVLSTR